jgi:hypothetical protein
LQVQGQPGLHSDTLPQKEKEKRKKRCPELLPFFADIASFFFFLVLGLELRAYTLSHATSSIFVKGFST